MSTYSPVEWLPVRRRPGDEEFREEIRAHLELEADRLVAEGMTPDEARAAARRAFGNVTQARERYYESRRVKWMDDLRTDVRHARRTLFRHPGFALVAILTLALGIGANAAIFSVVHAILLRPLPYKDADRLVRIAEIAPASRQTPPLVCAGCRGFSGSNALVLARRHSSADAGDDGGKRRADPGDRRAVDGIAAADAWSAGRGGRLFDARDERPGAEPTAIISHAIWQRHFGGMPDVIGKRIVLDGRDYTIAGVMTRSFQFLDRGAQFWLPNVAVTSGPAMRLRLPLTARLKDGVRLPPRSPRSTP